MRSLFQAWQQFRLVSFKPISPCEPMKKMFRENSQGWEMRRWIKYMF